MRHIQPVIVALTMTFFLGSSALSRWQNLTADGTNHNPYTAEYEQRSGAWLRTRLCDGLPESPACTRNGA